MRIIGEKSLATLVKYLLDLIFIGGIVIFVLLPVILKWYLTGTYGEVASGIFYFLLGLLYASGAFALCIVYQIRKIFKTLDGRDPFIMENVKSLKNIGIYSFLIAFCYVFKIFFFNSIATSIIIMIFIIAGFFTIILAEVFAQAVEAKQENDYTV